MVKQLLHVAIVGAGYTGLLANDVTMWVDGGGKVCGPFTQVLHGRMRVAQFVLPSTRFLPPRANAEIAEINGQPAMIIRVDRKAVIVIALEAQGDQVHEIRVIGNLEKRKRV